MKIAIESKLPHLTPRLALAASFVRPGSAVADIGTDHAYLPVYLVNAGICKGAVASDVRPGPLERARLTARVYGALEKVSFALADGLDGVEPAGADDVVIAGMGGELIAAIVGRCGWLRDPKKHLILQPMTSQEELRRFLCENGFTIEKEAVASEKGGRKLYLVISAHFTGVCAEKDRFYCAVGELWRNLGEDERAYLEYKARLLEKKARGLARAKDAADAEKNEARAAEELSSRILGIL